MIDVMFFLVVFFMLFTTFRSEPAGIPVDLPQASSGVMQEQSEVRITVTEQGAMFVNGVAAAPAQVRTQVRSAIDQRSDTIVIVCASPSMIMAPDSRPPIPSSLILRPLVVWVKVEILPSSSCCLNVMTPSKPV